MTGSYKFIAIFSEIEQFSLYIDIFIIMGEDGVFFDLSWGLGSVSP